MKNIKFLNDGICSVSGFECAGVEAGIKYENHKDMAIIFSKSPCVAAGVFTKNKVKAACVLYDKARLKNNIHAIIVNAGVANACTGKKGFEYCLESAKTAAKALNIPRKSILLASTGVIGQQLPMDNIKRGITILARTKYASQLASNNAALAIMTTDTTPKSIAIEVQLSGGKNVRLAGIAKGSGMINPNMATMLAFIVSDINISQKMLQKAIKSAVKDSFNMICVDGDTSTNDSVLLLSNSTASNKLITSKNADFKCFVKALKMISEILSKDIVRDGEGASKVICARVCNASSKKQARRLAKSVISSNLVKTAMFGNDANWGRIVCAMGNSGVDFIESNTNLFFQSKNGKIAIVKNGVALGFDEEFAKKILDTKEVEIVLDIKSGNKEAQAWGCDLSYEYIRINADYRS